MKLVGILLAAGSSRRFGSDKLQYPLNDGLPMVLHSACHLHSAVETVTAVVRTDAEALTELLVEAGCQVLPCPQANAGMGNSLATGIAANADADGWIIALADMPFIQPITIQQVMHYLQQGADIVAPCYNGQRGHPVGFSRLFGPALQALQGDQGARYLLHEQAALVTMFDTQDSGVLCDIDYLSQLC